MLDQVDAFFLADLRRAWTESPPLRRLAAAYLGFHPPPKASRDYHELLALFPAGTIR